MEYSLKYLYSSNNEDIRLACMPRLVEKIKQHIAKNNNILLEVREMIIEDLDNKNFILSNSSNNKDRVEICESIFLYNNIKSLLANNKDIYTNYLIHTI